MRVTPLRRFLPVIGGIVAIAVLILVGWWLLFGRGPEPASPGETSPQATVAEVADTPTAVAAVEEETPVPEETSTSAPLAASDGISLTLEPVEHVWVRVTVDGFATFEGMLAPAVSQTWVGDEKFILGPGDSIYHSSNLPHRNKNIGDNDVIMVFAKTPPSI